MALISYTDAARARTIFGRPPRRSSARAEAAEHPARRAAGGSHMPLDTEVHWTWRNPLNVIPAALLLVTLLAAVGTALGL